ncbi:MAG: glycosyltransferase family 4 protein, partial [Burkholderiales bacterium]
VTPDAQISRSFEVDHEDGFDVLRIRSRPLKQINLVRRAINEMLLSSRMWGGYRTWPAASKHYDGVVFYSPTIFFGRFIARIKALYNCRAYLILRDMFPEWAVDLGLMRKGPLYWVFKGFAQYQYSVADVIGIESPSNKTYFSRRTHKTEVLHNWIEVDAPPPPSISIPDSLRDHVIFVYAGNMGVAQDMDNLLRMARRLAERKDCRFLFVGGGSERARMEAEVGQLRLANVVFLPEIHPQELRGLLRQCHVGLVSLDRRLRSHNITGKLLSYLEAGLPVLASVNSGNDIKTVVEGAGAGLVSWNGQDDELVSAANRMLDRSDERARMAAAAKQLCRTRFSAAAAAAQISRGLARNLD